MNTNEQPNLTGDENGNVFVANGIQSEPIGAKPQWSFLTSAKAWQLAERSGQAAPYAGYMIELKDGRKLRCRRRHTHKTVFEVSLSDTRTIHSARPPN